MKTMEEFKGPIKSGNWEISLYTLQIQLNWNRIYLIHTCKANHYQQVGFSNFIIVKETIAYFCFIDSLCFHTFSMIFLKLKFQHIFVPLYLYQCILLTKLFDRIQLLYALFVILIHDLVIVLKLFIWNIFSFSFQITLKFPIFRFSDANGKSLWFYVIFLDNEHQRQEIIMYHYLFVPLYKFFLSN